MTEQILSEPETTSAETRFTLGAWLTLGVALLWLMLAPGLYFLSLTYPTDGWLTTAPVTRILLSNLSDTPSPLQVGDEVIAINGQSLTGDNPRPRLLPDRQEGQVVPYTVIRAGQTLDIAVTLKRLSPFDSFRSQINARSDWVAVGSQLLSLLIAAYVFWRRPGNTGARYLLLSFSCSLAISLFVDNSFYSASYPVPVSFNTNLLGLGPFWFLFPSWILFLLVFPVRKWPMRRFPRATPLIVYGLPILMTWPLAWLQLVTSDQSGVGAWLGPLPILIPTVGALATLIITFIHNWLTVRTPVERAQLRWLTFGLLLGWGGGACIGLYGILFNHNLAKNIGDALTMLFPLSLTIAILRYHLFDIAFIIRKTVLYTIVSGLALGVYLLAVGATSMVLGSQQRDFVIPLVVLIAAVLLFRPLANRLERWMDRVMPLKPRPQYDDEG